MTGNALCQLGCPGIASILAKKMAALAPLIDEFVVQRMVKFDGLLFLGINISQMMNKTGGVADQVSMENIEAAQEKNIQMFEYLESEIPGDFEHTTAMIFKEYNQKNVLRYVIETLFDDDDPHIRPDRKGLIFFDLKTILDCLDQ